MSSRLPELGRTCKMTVPHDTALADDGDEHEADQETIPKESNIPSSVTTVGAFWNRDPVFRPVIVIRAPGSRARFGVMANVTALR